MSSLIWASIYPKASSHTRQKQYNSWWELWVTWLSAQPLEGLESKVNSVSGLPCLCNRAIITFLDIKAQVTFPIWQYSMCIVTQHFWDELALSITPLGKDNWKLCLWNSPGFCHVSLSLTNFNLNSFTEINHNPECNSFWWVLWVLLMNYGIRG